VFHVNFENGTPYNPQLDYDVSLAIGKRMLWQIVDRQDLGWTEFCQMVSTKNEVTPDYVIRKFAETKNLPLSQLTIILLVDSLQKLPHDTLHRDSKTTEFYAAMSILAGLVNGSSDEPSFIICCTSATITKPFDEFVVSSAQKRVLLTPSPLIGEQIIPCDDDDFLKRTLVDDMGGHGRALEALQECLQEVQDDSALSLFQKIREKLRAYYPDWSHLSSYLLPLLKSLLGNLVLEITDIVEGTNTTVDNFCSMGLIRYDSLQKRLDAPFILVYILANYSRDVDDALKKLLYGTYESLDGIQTQDNYYALGWDQWEKFNAYFRILRSQLLAGKQKTLTQLHCGAKFHLTNSLSQTNFDVQRLEFAQASHQYKTSSGSKDLIQCEMGNFNVSSGSHFFLNGTSASAGDGWCALNSQLREIHQYKLVSTGINEASFIEERKKAAAKDDFFIVFSPLTCYKGVIPENSAIVDASCYKNYYGLFSGRAFNLVNGFEISINSATRTQLMCVENIGEKRANTILEERNKRPFDSLEDAFQRLGSAVNLPILKKFKFDNVQKK
jgi:hypothetical protein